MLGKVRKPIVLATSGALVVAVGVTLIGVRAHNDSTHNTPLTDASRVLQSVDVTMAPNGNLTAVKGTVVGTTTNRTSFTNTYSYAPAPSQPHIPVRIQTSYRTKDRTGTNLADLDGYTGPLQLQFDVQNLTVKPRVVHYNVNGEEKTRSALVGVPMTVVASTVLPGIKPSAVHTTKAGAYAATNGVLSQNDQGDTQVQWATILAPPQLGSSTTLTLSLDATDFKAPDVDLSVQPGLVTDPSIGAIIDTAFNPGNSSEMALERRTVDVIGQVTQVLGRAGKTIARVRSALNQSSQQLGTQTVRDLQDGTNGVAQSIRGLSSSIQSLGGSLNSSLQQTKSQTLAELQQMVQTVDTMLGDTSATPPKTQVSGSGCALTVAKPKGATSIYGTLLQVQSQLNAYAKATDACKTAITTALQSGLDAAESSLQGANQQFVSIASDLNASAASISNAITSDSKIADAQTQADDLKSFVDGLQVNGLDFSQAITDYRNAKAALRAIVSAVNAVHREAGSEQLGLARVNDDLADEICTLASKGDITPDVAATLRSYTSTVQCDGTTAVSSAPDHRQPLAVQIAALQDLATQTDLTPADPSTGSPLYVAVTAAQSALNDMAVTLPGLAVQSNGLSAALRDKVTALDQAVTAVNAALSTTATDAQKALQGAGTRAQRAGAAAVDEAIRTIGQQTTTSQGQLGQMFALSQAGLTAAADQISTDGAKAINQQKAAFAQQEKASGANVSQAVDQGLGQVAQSVNGSTKDLSAAQRLLIADLHNVLLDIGTPSVKGSGLLGAMASSSSTAGAANYQLALASRAASSYGNVRGADISALLLRQAQTDEAIALQSELPAFRLTLPASTEHHTVYNFHLQAGN